MHGPTYMGNALACAAANASLDLFEREPRIAPSRAHRSAAPPRPRTRARDCRACATCASKAPSASSNWKRLNKDDLRRRFIEKGVWIRPFGNIVYTTPPFTITDDELKTVTSAMVKVLQELR